MSRWDIEMKKFVLPDIYFGGDYTPEHFPKEVMEEYGVKTFSEADQLYKENYDAIILAVAHRQFDDIDFPKLNTGSDAVIFDIK